MTNHTILVPTDFSPCSQAALHQAELLARAQQSRLLIVHVSEPVVAYSDMGVGAFAIEADQEAVREALHQVRPEDPGIPVEYALLEGDPADEIVRCAQEKHADLIVIATHGRRGLTRMLMGSVAEAVVRRAVCPVLTVKPGIEASLEPMPVIRSDEPS